MRLAWIGCSLLLPGWVLGWPGLAFALIVMITGVMLSYKPPQQDPVWRLLERDGVINQDGDKPWSND